MFQNLCHEWQNPWFMWNGHSSKYCDLVSEIPKRFHYLKVFQRSCYSERETSIPGWLAQIVSGLKTSCLQQSLWPPCWTDLAAPWLRVGSAYFPGSCFYLQKQEASTVPSDRKIGYKTQSQKRKKKKASFSYRSTTSNAKDIAKDSPQPPDSPLCNYNSFKLFIMGWALSSCSYALDT